MARPPNHTEAGESMAGSSPAKAFKIVCVGFADILAPLAQNTIQN